MVTPLSSRPQFCGTIVLIFFLELAVAVLAFLFQDWVRDRFREFFESNIRSYRDDIDLQNLIDSLQKAVSPRACSPGMPLGSQAGGSLQRGGLEGRLCPWLVCSALSAPGCSSRALSPSGLGRQVQLSPWPPSPRSPVLSIPGHTGGCSPLGSVGTKGQGFSSPDT